MLHAYVRTLIMYLTLVAVIRILGKRQVGQMAPSEFVVTMFIANLASASIEDPEATPVYGLIAIFTILGAELTLSWLTMGSIRMRRLLCGKPVILIRDGRLLQDSLRKTRITLDELTGKLRQKDVLDLTTVRYAILETDGSISVFLYGRDQPAAARDAGIRTEDPMLPVSLIEDGVILQENLKRSGKTPEWVQGVLRDRQALQRETLLLTVDERDHIFFLRKEGKL